MTTEEREAAILSLREKVSILATQMVRRLPNNTVSREDLVSSGWIGAIKAVDRYRPERGISLNAFSERRIKGEMLDYLRRVDALSRPHRKRVKAGKMPDCDTISLGTPIESHGKQKKTLADILISPDAENDFQRLANRIDCDFVAANEYLSAKQSRYLKFYFAGLCDYDISRQLNVSLGRSCQLFGEIVIRLRRRIGLAG